MNKQDISTIINLHFEEMTELEQVIARYFLQVETIHDDLSSQEVTQKLHISQAALTRFAKKCGFKGYREFIFRYPTSLTIRYESLDTKSFEKLY